MISKSPFSQDEYIRLLLAGLDTPRSLSVWLLYENKEHDQLCELDFSPHDYNDVDAARNSLLATKFLSKATFLKTSYDVKRKAFDTFIAAEQQCLSTNRRLIECNYSSCTASALLSMSRKISMILGEVDAEEFVSSCNFGPGATTKLPRYKATHPNKYDFESHITSDAYDFVKDWFEACYPNWVVKFEIQNSSKIVTVPKNAKTDRTIAIEPGINLWFQKGIGSVLRRRLRDHGIDLNCQRHNQAKARVGSKYKSLATVDFSSASDTISKELVRDILPLRWFVLLDAFRSKSGMLEGRPINFEKFSSMGNGFTFELETLIFYSLAIAICEQLGIESSDVSVYGDDVIIPSSAFELYSFVAAELGFSVNTKKSYSSSYYRESCGAHYWNGIDIKPIFQKEPINGKASLLLAANNVRRCAYSRNTYGCDRRLLYCWQYLVRFLKDAPRIPEGYGDIGLIENLDHPSVTATRAPHQLEGWYVRCWAPIAYTIFCESKGLLLSKLRAMGISLEPCERGPLDMASIGNNTPIPFRTRASKIRLHVTRWNDLGPWI